MNKQIRKLLEKEKLKTKLRDASLRKLMLPFVTFNLLSLFSTGAGFYALITSDGSGLGPGLLAVAIAGVLTFSLQSGIFVFVTHISPTLETFLHPSRFLKWLLTLVGYAVFTFLSVSFAISFYFGIMGAKNYADDIWERQYSHVRNYVDNIESKFSEIARAAKVLSDKSDVLMEQESAFGGTCPGGKNVAGKGPAYYTRAYQKAEFNALNEMASSKLEIMNSYIMNIRFLAEGGDDGFGVQYSDALTDVQANRRTSLDVSTRERLSKLKEYLASFNGTYVSALSDLNYREKLQVHLGAEFKGYPDTPEYRSRRIAGFACRDSSTSSAIENILSISLPPVNDLDVKVYDPNSHMETLKLIANEMYSAFGRLLGDAERNVVNVSAFSVEYLLPIFFGVVFDFIIFVLGILVGYKDMRVANDDRLHRFADLYRKLIGIRNEHPVLEGIMPMHTEYKMDMVGYASDYILWILDCVGVKGLVESEEYIFCPALNVGIDGDAKASGTDLENQKKSQAFARAVSDIVDVLKDAGYVECLGDDAVAVYEGLTYAEAYGDRIGADVHDRQKFYVYRINDDLKPTLLEFQEFKEFYRHELAMRWYNYLGVRDTSYDDLLVANFTADPVSAWVYILETSDLQTVSKLFSNSPETYRILDLWRRNEAHQYLLEKIKTDKAVSSNAVEKGILKVGWFHLRFPIVSIVLNPKAIDYIFEKCSERVRDSREMVAYER